MIFRSSAWEARGPAGSGKSNNRPTERQQKEDNLKERSSERNMQRDQPRPFNTPRAPSGPERIYWSNAAPRVSGQVQHDARIRCRSPWYPETCVQNPRIPGAKPPSNISAPGLKAPEACRMVEVGLSTLTLLTHLLHTHPSSLTFFAHCGVCVEGLYVSC